MCLAALLLQPEKELPGAMIIDEPELGLHPFALETIAALIRRASEYCQVIIATQSVELLNAFSPEDIITVERRGQESVFRRHNESELTHWLERYTLGELWQKNVIGGGPY
jgi:predicted ATPase